MILAIVFVVVMVIWFFTAIPVSTSEQPLNIRFIGSSFLPWLAVAILGYVAFHGIL
jgi:hypothetical protein